MTRSLSNQPLFFWEARGTLAHKSAKVITILLMANKTQQKHMADCCKAAADVLKRDRILRDDGSASVGMGGGDINFEDARELLALAFPFNADVDSHHRQQIVTEALFKVAKEPDDEKIVASLVESEIARHEKKYRSTRRKKFFLLTQVSLSSSTPFPKRIRLNNATICFYCSRPDQVRIATGMEDSIEALGIDKHIRGWMYVKVYVEGRDAIEAGTRALRELNLLRAIWNYVALRGQASRSCSPTERPLSVFRLAPMQTIHLVNPTPCPSSVYWYQQPYLATDFPGKAWNPGAEKFEKVRAAEKKIRGTLRESTHSNFLASQFQKYIAACDIAPHDERFMALWTLLEHLTGCGEGGKMDYALLVRRAANIFADYKAYRLILSSLRSVRNSVAHDMRSDFEPHSANKLFWIVNCALNFHLGVSRQIRSKSDVFAFLDLPHDPEQLKTEIKLRRRRLDSLSHLPESR